MARSFSIQQVRLASMLAMCMMPWLLHAGTATITVGEQRQVFEALGFSMNSYRHSAGDLYGSLSQSDQERLFDGLNINAVRLWVTPGEPVDEIAVFRDVMVGDGVFQMLKDNGVEHLVTGPEGFKHYGGDPEAYAMALADMNERIVKEFGVELSAVGVENEPGCGGRAGLTPDQGKVLLKTLRRELDSRGLAHLEILSPEFCGNDNFAKNFIRELGEDSAALDAYHAVGTHSYNSGADEEMWELVDRFGKEWWMTEAGEIGHLLGLGSGSFDGSDAGARFLGDINTGVTHFIWFFGAGGSSDHYLMAPRVYPYMKLISDTFLPGTQMYHVTSDVPGHEHLHWGHHRDRPPIIAAAGIRPDGKWGIGVLNLTRDLNTIKGNFWPKEEYTVELVVPALADVSSLAFDACEHGPSQSRTCNRTITLEQGRATIELPQSKLVTLIAQEAVGTGDALGGTTSGTTGATTGTGTATTCNLITRGAQIPQGFAAPYNVLSATQEMLVTVNCSSTGATLSVGTGNALQYVYNLAYTWRNNQWQQVNLTGQNLVSGAWLVGSAQGTLPQSTAELSQQNHVVAYVCTWTGTEWKCGCRDQTCAQGQWQLQVFRR